MTKTIEQLTAELELAKQQLKDAKKNNRPKQAVIAELHTAKDSGKLSIAIGQGFRKAYLNKDQITFIFDNRASITEMLTKL